jgi:predicted transcriptional regulator
MSAEISLQTTSQKTKKRKEVVLDSRLKAANILRAINHKIRLKIIDFVKGQNELGISPNKGDINITFNLQQPVASNHIQILIEIGVLKTIQSGKYHLLKYNDKRMNEIQKWIEAMPKIWD